MKPKHRDLPVSLAVIKVASMTLPNESKAALNSASVTSGWIPPTKIFSVLSCLSLGMALFGSIFIKIINK